MSDKDFQFDDDFLNDDSDSFDFNGDDEFPSDLSGDQMPSFDEEPPRRSGTSPVFVILAILMILIFIGALILVVFLITRPQGPTPNELTSTQVVLLNQTVEAQLAQTQTQAREFEILTLTASSFTDTPEPTNTPTETPEPTVTEAPATVDATDQAATAFALALTATFIAENAATETPDVDLTAEAIAAMTLTALSVPPDLTATQMYLDSLPSPTLEIPPTSALSVINQTATAITGAFLTATAEAAAGAGGMLAVGTPTSETGGVIVTPGFPTAIPTLSSLPDTGLFDDIVGGDSAGLSALGLGVVGLVGVIVVSRRLRNSNASKLKEDETNKTE